jgi:peptide/nickel transport system substrate-binding protein
MAILVNALMCRSVDALATTPLQIFDILTLQRSNAPTLQRSNLFLPLWLKKGFLGLTNHLFFLILSKKEALMRKLTLSLSFMVLLLVLLAGCQKIEEFQYSGKKGGTLVISLLNEPSNLNPIYPSLTGTSPVTGQLFTPLISEKPNGKVRPALAESWIYSEDLSSITYTIAKDAAWHDGKPVTAEDVVFTVEQILNSKNNSPVAQKLTYVENVEAVSTREVRFDLNQVYAGELQSTNIYPIPKHILEREENLANADFNSSPVGSGPYKIEEWNKGKWIELTANSDYFRGRPPVDRMVFYTPSSVEELLFELGEGSVDLAFGMPPGVNYDTLSSYSKVLSPGKSYTYIGWNMEKFPDKKLRQAFSIAIDRKGIISDVLKDYGEVVNGPITPEHWAYNQDLKNIRYDKEGAINLIEQLGYLKRRGRRYYEGLNVRILVEAGNAVRSKVAERIVADLRDVGVNALISTVSSVDFISYLFRKDFDAYIMGWNVEKEFNPFQIWGSDGTYNFVGYKNSRVDDLIGEALLSLDREKAKKALYEFQEIIRDDLPYTFLYSPREITLVKKNVQGIEVDDKRSVISFVDELWFRSTPGEAVDIALLGTDRKSGKELAREAARAREETPRAEEILQAAAAPAVPERKTTTTTAPAAGREPPKEEEPEELPKFVPHEVPPKPLNLDKVAFTYPEVAKSLGLKGTVYLQLWIDEKGNVTNVTLIKSVHPILDKVAVTNARKLKFSPARQGDKPVAVPLSFPVRFKQ